MMYQREESLSMDFAKFVDSMQPVSMWGVAVLPDPDGKPDIIILLEKKKGKIKAIRFREIEMAVETYLKSQDYKDCWANVSRIYEACVNDSGV